MKRVLVAEPHPQVLEALADLVAEESGLELSGIASTADEAISLARRLQPDVVLIDVDEPSWRGKRLDHQLSELLPKALLIRLHAASDPEQECPESPASTPQSIPKTSIPEFLRSLAA
jgi:DNA-binding NarL/FixJ family response regulator